MNIGELESAIKLNEMHRKPILIAVEGKEAVAVRKIPESAIPLMTKS